jgi:hypothetical protein
MPSRVLFSLLSSDNSFGELIIILPLVSIAQFAGICYNKKNLGGKNGLINMHKIK